MWVKKVTGSFLVLLCLILFCFLISVSAQGGRQNNDSGRMDKGTEAVLAEQIIIPSIDSIRANGYPINDRGETYGPNVKEFDFEPDLILVKSGDIYGYIRKSDLDDDGVRSLDEALGKESSTRELNIYLQDGITQIGTFKIEGEK